MIVDITNEKKKLSLIGSLYKAGELSAGEILSLLPSCLRHPPAGRGGGGVTPVFYPSANHYL